MIIFLKRPAFHSEHFHFSEHEKRKDQNNLKPHYKIAPKGAWLPYQICEFGFGNGVLFVLLIEISLIGSSLS